MMKLSLVQSHVSEIVSSVRSWRHKSLSVQGDPRQSSWAETGEKYLLKLFSDYVFRQVDADGNTVANLSHILDSLNKVGVCLSHQCDTT